jgi:hypothetical protein
MGLRHSPTATNREAARDLAPEAARSVLQALAVATTPMTAVATAATAEPDAVVAAAAAFIAALPEVHRQLTLLLGVSVMGGASVSGTARRCGMRPQTLSDHLISTQWAQFRGLDMAKSPDGTWAVTK